MSRSTIYEMRRAGTLHFIRIGRSVLVSVAELQEVMRKAEAAARDVEREKGLRKPAPVCRGKSKDLQAV